MPLFDLVNHFNDRFGAEHHSSLRPFSADGQQASGLFGPIRIGSAFAPIRLAEDPEKLLGHLAKLLVSPRDTLPPTSDDSGQAAADFQSIINLDRLTRTVHMLNYLPLAHLNGVLFLDVDPRHVVSVSGNHGAYFEEIIAKCGLATKNVAISVALNGYYTQNHGLLLEGLRNYRQRGYQLALNIGSHYDAPGLAEFFSKLIPDYLRVDAPGFGDGDLSLQVTWPTALPALQAQAEQLGIKTLLQRVDDKTQAALVAGLGFHLVQGQYYDALAVDHLRCL